MKKLYNLSWIDEDNITQSEILIPSNTKLLIGRLPTTDIIVADLSVSRIHAQLFWKNNVLHVKDLNSSFGTWVNNKRLKADQNKALYENGEIRLGRLSMWYEIRDEDDKQRAMQTCFFTRPITDESELTSELSEFKVKLLQNIKVHSPVDILSKPLKDSLNKEIHILFEKHEEQLKEQRILNSISHVLNRSNTLSELSDNALSLISKVLSAERGFVVLYNQKTMQFELIGKRHFEETEQPTEFIQPDRYSSTLIDRCREQAEIIIIDDVQESQTLVNLESISTSETSSVAVIPLIRQEQVVGVIYLDSSRSKCFEERQIPFFETFAAHTSIALHNAQLYKRAITDDLTRLYTRQYIDERLEQEHERAKRYNRPFCVIMVDLDHFKRVNDTYGHSAGDLVLQNVSSILRQQLRDTDIAGRLGGEEFIVILGETQKEGAKNIAERIREEIERTHIEKDGKVIKVTTSIGLACYNDYYKDQFEKLLEDADKALYQAKNNGRNKVVVSK